MLQSSEMNPLTLLVLRRLALYALLLAVALVIVFRVLPAYGVLGPSLAEEVESATRAVEAARGYGASPEIAAFRQAEEGLARARSLGAGGQAREGRRAARAARAHAIDAQRLALTRRETLRREAERITLEVDRRLTELEELYGEVVPGLGKEDVSRLLSSMKAARRSGAGLYLSYEAGEYVRVGNERAATFEVLDATRESLRAAKSLPRVARKTGGKK